MSQTNTDPHPRSSRSRGQAKIGCASAFPHTGDDECERQSKHAPGKNPNGTRRVCERVQGCACASVCAITHAFHHRLIPNKDVIISRAVALFFRGLVSVSGHRPSGLRESDGSDGGGQTLSSWRLLILVQIISTLAAKAAYSRSRRSRSHLYKVLHAGVPVIHDHIAQ
jgi:hypothetical protein